jgi:hypothetical protein
MQIVDDHVVCPVCGYDCVHPISVAVEPVCGETRCLVDAFGVHVTPSDIINQVRGAVVTLAFLCEAGHQWSTRLEFRKGYTMASTIQGQTVEGAITYPPTLWRD